MLSHMDLLWCRATLTQERRKLAYDLVKPYKELRQALQRLGEHCFLGGMATVHAGSTSNELHNACECQAGAAINSNTAKLPDAILESNFL